MSCVGTAALCLSDALSRCVSPCLCLCGLWQTNEMRREQLEASLGTINNQLHLLDVKYRAHVSEVQAREEEIKQSRHELVGGVEKVLTESGSNFKQGRAQMVKSLAEYETACNRMSQRLEVIKDIADELAVGVLPSNVETKKWEPGTMVNIQVAPLSAASGRQIYHGPIATSPMGAHYTSPMGTVRRIGEVHGIHG